jgi:hypothetical protein
VRSTPYFRVLWLVGLALLAVGGGVHVYEHWEIAAHAQCVAHPDKASDHDDGGPKHDHGCTSHDHAPALAGTVFLLTVSEVVAPFSAKCPVACAARAEPFEQPPRLS